MKDQIRELLGDAVEEMDVSEQRERVEELVQFERFVPESVPSSPCERDHLFANPGIELYCEHLEWGDRGWEPVSDTEVLQENVPEYMPTDTAIETIAEYGPVLEVGAGSGYWSYVLAEAGVEVIATDLSPPDVVTDDLPAGYYDAIGSDEYQFISVERSERESYQKMWDTVHIADHSCIKSYPSHSILFCHPEGFEWTEEVLDLCHLGQELVLVAEWYPGADATPMFFKRLAENWELKETFPVYDWASMHVGGYVFEKQSCD